MPKAGSPEHDARPGVLTSRSERPSTALRLAAAAFLCVWPSQGSGAPPRTGVGDLRGEYEASSRARDEAKDEAERLRAEIADLQTQLDQLNLLQTSGERAAGGKRTRLQALNAREAALEADMGRNQTELAALLGALALYRRQPPPALLVTPGSAKDAVRAAILARAVEPELARRAAAFRAQAEQLQRLRRAVDAVSEDVFTSESALADRRARIEQTLAQKRALEQKLAADAVEAGASVQSLATRLRALGVDSDRLGPPAAAGGSLPASLRAPVEGVLIRRFGDRSPGGRRSDGFTWRTAKAALVRAPAAGVVEYSGALKGWGGVLILARGGYHLVLAGLDRIDVASGRQVADGDAVGAMGGGQTQAPELYLEIRKDGAPQDPARWLRIARSAAGAARR
jgi:septal ring factor EnvC (AmiA/AmiB activator)